MKLLKFRIRDYKSIVDSQDCYPAERVTILAGKNEAGKSSLLEALEDFNLETQIRDRAIPIGKPDAKPSIEVVYQIDKREATEIIGMVVANPEVANALVNALSDKNLLTVRKVYPATYEVSSPIFDSLPPSKPLNWEGLVTGLFAAISSIQVTNAARHLELPPFRLESFDPTEAKATLDQYKARVSESDGSLNDSEKALLDEKIALLEQSINLHAASQTDTPNRLKDAFLRRCPNFVLFSSFDDVFPNEIALSELASNKWIKDLESMSDIDASIINGANRNAKKEHKHQLNLQLNKDFSQFWTQDLSKLSIDWDSDRLEFWIEENHKFYPPELRSQGRRWHLAFYIRVSARARGDVPNIILIDEPGLYLHATAQRDILKHLEDASASRQILISTHSPYLIEPNKLERIRLVQKTDERGTYVENKVHAVSDKETLTPILTAIGLELNQGIVGANKQDNVIVEGPSDYFYLTSFRELFDEFKGSFVSGGSSGNMPKIGTILQGWGCRVIYLYDSDKAFEDAKNAIKKDWVTISKDWLTSLNVDGAIEDIFSKEEFAQIIGVEPGAIQGKNSEYIKGARRDKVLPARVFLEKVRSKQEIGLSEPTQATVRSLLQGLQKKFDEYKA